MSPAAATSAVVRETPRAPSAASARAPSARGRARTPNGSRAARVAATGRPGVASAVVLAPTATSSGIVVSSPLRTLSILPGDETVLTAARPSLSCWFLLFVFCFCLCFFFCFFVFVFWFCCPIFPHPPSHPGPHLLGRIIPVQIF